MYNYLKQKFGYGPKLSLKVMVNKEKTKVLFAESDREFVDVLFSFLALPLGKIIKILNENYDASSVEIPGCLNSLYKCVSDLDSSFFSVPGAKQILLNPQTSFGTQFRKLAVDISDSPPRQFFVCSDSRCSLFQGEFISLYSDITKCVCGKLLNKGAPLPLSSTNDWQAEFGAAGVVLATTPLSFIICDDLCVAPILTGTIQTLSNLGITDTQGAEVMHCSFGVNEIRDLLKFSLTSATPLTEMILKKKSGVCWTCGKPEPGLPLHPTQTDHLAVAHSRKMCLTVCLQKSTNKFLFAEATDDFVEILFSLLTVPIGGVEFLLGGKSTGLNCIDNLYRSVNDIDVKCFRSPEMKDKLINPKLPHGYISEDDQFLPLIQEAPPMLRYKLTKKLETTFDAIDGSLVRFKFSKDMFVKKQTMCFVMDDLTVIPSLSSNLSIVNALGVPFSDMKEMVLQIGLQALSILKASLTSTTALTDGLINPMLKKINKN